MRKPLHYFAMGGLHCISVFFLLALLCLRLSACPLASAQEASAAANSEVLGIPKPPNVTEKLPGKKAQDVQGSLLGLDTAALPGQSGQKKAVAATLPRPPRVPVSTVALLTFLMAAATGLGSIPFFFFELEDSWQSLCNGMACGVMLAASFDLIQEGQVHGGGHCVVIGIILGGLFIIGSQKVLERFGDVKMMSLKGQSARRMVLIVAIMTLHSFGEGSGVGVSFAGPKGFQQGLLVTIAIAVHNVPEGLAVSMVMASRGVKPRDAMLWSVFTSLPQPLVAVPAFICAETFSQFLPISVGFAAGCMIWIVFGEVMPESLENEHAKPSHVASAATVSVALMELVGTLLEGLEAPPGWDTLAPFGWSTLFVLGPILGALAVVFICNSLLLHSSLLAGLSVGVTLTLSLWRPLQLLLSGKMNFFALLLSLYVGFFVYSTLARLCSHPHHRKGEVEGGSLESGRAMGLADKIRDVFPTATSRIPSFVCMALSLHGLIEGLMVGAAAPKAGSFGIHMLLPVSLHGLPRGMSAAAAWLGLGRTSASALAAAGVTGMAGPVGAMLAMATSMSAANLDYWLVVACGLLLAAAVVDLRPRAFGLDKRKASMGAVLGVIVVFMGLSGSRMLCLRTTFCNAAPEALT